jgi:phage nucleotide-binding protein
MKFTKAPEVINRGLSFIVYADPGVGKTTMVSTLPVDETLIVNTEAGLGPLLGTGHSMFDLRSASQEEGILKTIEKLHKYLVSEKHPFKNVAFDNVSELEQLIVQELTTRRRKEFTEIKEYGDSAQKMREYLHYFRDLIYRGINVVFTAWESPIEIKNHDGEIITKTFPRLSKRLAPEACGIVDAVGHLEVYEKSGVRWVRFSANQQYVCKCQFKGLASDGGEPADFPTIINKLKAYNYKEKQDGN